MLIDLLIYRLTYIMPPCKNDPKAHYKGTEPSPKGLGYCAHAMKVGTKKKGRDGQMWIIKKDKVGTRKWMKVVSAGSKTAKKPVPKKIAKPVSTKSATFLKFNYDRVTEFNLDGLVKNLKLGKPKKIGSINITGNSIGVGELVTNEFPAKKGRYNIYICDFSLIAIHESSSLENQMFHLTNKIAGCDIGMFAYCDYARVKPFFQRKDVFPEFYVFGKGSRNKINGFDAYYVYQSDFRVRKGKQLMEIPNTNHTEPVALFAGNGFGDGTFLIYKSVNGYFIMSLDVENKLMDMLGINF